MKKIKQKPFPKKAKLITDGGFYRIIKVGDFRPRIDIPLLKKIRLATPETLDIDLELSIVIEFVFSRVFGGYAEYRQMNVVTNKNIIK